MLYVARRIVFQIVYELKPVNVSYRDSCLVSKSQTRSSLFIFTTSSHLWCAHPLKRPDKIFYPHSLKCNEHTLNFEIQSTFRLSTKSVLQTNYY